MNFQGCLGQHTQDSGLGEIWTESGLLGDNSVQQIMAGKSYARSVRAHKLTFQALWHFLLPKLYSYLEELDKDYKTDLLESVQKYDTSCSVDTLTNILASDTFKRHMDTFVDHIKNENPDITFWWNYMEMVNILLYFIRAQRDGLWDLHLFSFRKMLPFSLDMIIPIMQDGVLFI